jgi:neutral ceramidase
MIFKKSKISPWWVAGALFLGAGQDAISQSDKVFKAGAATSVITPSLGYSINGNMQDAKAKHIHDDTHAKAIVMDDGTSKLAIVVSDLCMAYKETLDNAKKKAHAHTGIPVDHMMMSATHTHSGGTACSVFQSDPDAAYLEFLSDRIADALIRAHNNLVPAEIGWGKGHEASQVHNRRWYLKDGSTNTNPFGGVDKVRMNPGIKNPDLKEPAGPIDPEVSVVALKSLTGDPIAVLANYSLHYVGGTGPGEVSADYFGMFGKRMKELVGEGDPHRPFVGIMSNGTSGDINNIDWKSGSWKPSGAYAQMQRVANILAAEAYQVVSGMQYKSWVELASAQKEISLAVRKPTAQELTRAKDILAKHAGETVLTNREAIYARESVLMDKFPNQVPLIIQAFRIGDLAISAIPCEVFAEIGLEIKGKSPFESNFTISLANGYNGYLPTPKHHALGGYETWRARSSYLEVNASEKILNTLFPLLNGLKKGN